jgi:hypothetical protein
MTSSYLLALVGAEDGSVATAGDVVERVPLTFHVGTPVGPYRVCSTGGREVEE